MLIRLCLLAQVAFGVGFVAMRPVHQWLFSLESIALGRLWLNGLALFGIPICLMVLGIRRTRPIDYLHLAWGLWTAILSIAVLIQLASGKVALGQEGQLCVAGYLAVSLSIAIGAARAVSSSGKSE